MPCPFFEPLAIVAEPTFADGRLPLIDEYEGVCRATLVPSPAPRELLRRCCNHGYSQGCCELFPRQSDCSSLRYSVLKQTPVALDVICVEEHDYAPVRWHHMKYSIETGSIEGSSSEVCRTAQTLAFCRSYLLRFPHVSDS